MDYSIGIDLSTRSSQICVINQDHEVLLNKSYPNDLKLIRKVLRPYATYECAVAIEATCNWYWIVDGLRTSGWDVRLVHALKLKAITTAKVKTDKRDAEWLAKLTMGGLLPEAHICPKELRYLRDLNRWRWRFVNRRSLDLVQLRHLCVNEGDYDESRTFYQTVSQEGELPGRFHRHLELPVTTLIDHRDFLNERIDEIDAAIEDAISKRAEWKWQYRYLCEIPGVGSVNASTILLESGEIDRFHSDRCYVSYARLTPGIAQSGDRVKRGRAAKAGNPHLKRAFTMAACIAGRIAGPVQRYRDRQRERRTGSASKLVVNNAIANKYAKCVYHMLTKKRRWEVGKAFSSD